MKASPGAHERLPAVRCDVGPRGQQQYLHLSASRLLDAMQPGGQYLALVRHQQITRRKIVADVTKHAVFDGAAMTMEHEETRGVARLDRRLRDQRRRKLIVV